MNEIIVDQSTIQKALRVEKLRAELFGLGYSIVANTTLAKLVEDARQFAKEHRT